MGKEHFWSAGALACVGQIFGAIDARVAQPPSAVAFAMQEFQDRIQCMKL
jgi:hypothetical protein